MRLWAILAGAAALAILAGCQRPAPPPVIADAPVGPPDACGRPAISDGGTFVRDRVRMLYQDPKRPNFEQNFTSDRYYPPLMYNRPPPEPYAQDIAAAFDAAPPFLKSDLSKCIDVVFVDATHYSDGVPFGWSFWEVSNDKETQRSGTGRYVALGGRLWTPNADGTKFGLVDLETLILGAISGTPGWNVQAGGSVNSHLAAIIAALAREVALSLNHDFVRNGKLVCPSKGFWTTSWLAPNGLPDETGIIRKLGARPLDDVHTICPYPPLSAIQRFVHTDLRRAEQDLAQVLGLTPLRECSQLHHRNFSEWGSLLAYASPDDDFAETYRLLALKGAGVTSLVLTLPGPEKQTIDLLRNLGVPSSTYLGQKVACVQKKLPLLTGSPPIPVSAPR